jgi:hypothetical protein
MSGYADKSAAIDMAAGVQHDPVSMSLDKQVVSSIMILAIAAIILSAVLGLLSVAALLLIIIVLWKRHAITKALVTLVKSLK